MSECSHKWHAETCLFCKLERERDEARAEVARLTAHHEAMHDAHDDWRARAKAALRDVAERQREACAATMAKSSSVWGDMVRAAPLVTDAKEEP